MGQTVSESGGAPGAGAAPAAPGGAAAIDPRTMRHSAAHALAEAVQQLFPEAKFGIGPAIEDGFYYDFDLPRSLTPDDLEEIERRMKAIVAADEPFERRQLDRDAALALFTSRDQPYKVELI